MCVFVCVCVCVDVIFRMCCCVCDGAGDCCGVCMCAFRTSVHAMCKDSVYEEMVVRSLNKEIKRWNKLCVLVIIFVLPSSSSPLLVLSSFFFFPSSSSPTPSSSLPHTPTHIHTISSINLSTTLPPLCVCVCVCACIISCMCVYVHPKCCAISYNTRIRCMIRFASCVCVLCDNICNI